LLSDDEGCIFQKAIISKYNNIEDDIYYSLSLSCSFSFDASTEVCMIRCRPYAPIPFFQRLDRYATAKMANWADWLTDEMALIFTRLRKLHGLKITP